MSAYNDKNISLNNISLTQFEMAREIPAAIDLFASKPQNLDIQMRMVIIKLNAVLHNLQKKNKINIVIGLDFLSFLNPMIRFLHGDKRDNMEIFSFELLPYVRETRILKELNLEFTKNNIFTSDAEMVSRALKNDGLLIAVLGSNGINPARECIDAFSTGKTGFLFIHNYSIEQSPSHHLYAVERGLRIIENPDGSGECFSI